MVFLKQFEEYANNSGYTQNEIDMNIDSLKILNKITWSKNLKNSPDYFGYNYAKINFDNIYNKIVNTFFYDHGGKKNNETLTIYDNNGKSLVYKYKDEANESITKLYMVDTTILKKINQLFVNATEFQKEKIFTKLPDRTIGKIFEEINNILFIDDKYETFLRHLKFEYLEPVNENENKSHATKYMNDELLKGKDAADKYYFHTKFFMKLITIFIEEINESNKDKKFFQSIYKNKIELELEKLKDNVRKFKSKKRKKPDQVQTQEVTKRQKQMQEETKRQEQMQEQMQEEAAKEKEEREDDAAPPAATQATQANRPKTAPPATRPATAAPAKRPATAPLKTLNKMDNVSVSSPSLYDVSDDSDEFDDSDEEKEEEVREEAAKEKEEREDDAAPPATKTPPAAEITSLEDESGKGEGGEGKKRVVTQGSVSGGYKRKLKRKELNTMSLNELKQLHRNNGIKMNGNKTVNALINNYIKNYK